MKNYYPAISTEIERYADRDHQRYNINCCKESSNLKNMWKLKIMDTESRSNGPFEKAMTLLSRANPHYWTDTNGLNIHLVSYDNIATRNSKEVVSTFISSIFIQEFPDMDPVNARVFGHDFADEITMSDQISNGKGNIRSIRIEWSSIALVYLYNETRSNETIPILIDNQYYNIRKRK
ncbi:hypothetical protein ACT9XH_07960 [Methanococcoides methylutens]|uniref:hypothetical protein n=1 Tax=Methanococcoides methylutens TaxID=2226 RepID=UPI004043F92A